LKLETDHGLLLFKLFLLCRGRVEEVLELENNAAVKYMTPKPDARDFFILRKHWHGA
jgi:hypothetical protein